MPHAPVGAKKGIQKNVKKLFILFTECTHIYNVHIIVEEGATFSLSIINLWAFVMETQGVFYKFLNNVSITFSLRMFD
jgi:hypothetical protein